HDDRLVALHLLRQRLVDRLAVADGPGHECASSDVRLGRRGVWQYGMKTSVVRSAPVGLGAALASATASSMSRLTSLSISSSWWSASWPVSVTRPRKRLRQSSVSRALATSSAPYRSRPHST